MYYESDRLQHHGILGQKWGIRRYQNPDGTLTEAGRKRVQKQQNKNEKKLMKTLDRSKLTKERTIPKGTKMFRTSVNPNEKLSGSTYVSYLKADRDHYKSGWIRQTGKANESYEYEFELKEDLKIPSREEQEKVIMEVVNNNSKNISEICNSYFDQIMPKNSFERLEIDSYEEGGFKKFVDNTIKQFGTWPVSRAAYTTCQSLGLATNVREQIIKKLSDNGYNAMVDEASVGGRNNFGKEGIDPLIIFDSSCLETVNRTLVTQNDEKKYKEDYNNWRQYVSSKDGKWSNESGEIL